MAGRWRWLRSGRLHRLVLAGLAGALAAPLLAATRPGTPAPLFSAGLLGNERALEPVPPAAARGAAYIAGSNVLVLADGRRRYLPPGATPAEREAAGRSLLDLRLLVRPGGAALAAQTPYWAYVWPRDARFVSAAFAV